MRANCPGGAFERDLSGIASTSILYINICLKENLYISKIEASAIATRSMEDFVRFRARKRLFPLSDYMYVTLLFTYYILLVRWRRDFIFNCTYTRQLHCYLVRIWYLSVQRFTFPTVTVHSFLSLWLRNLIERYICVCVYITHMYMRIYNTHTYNM